MGVSRGTGNGERDFPSETKQTEDYRQLQPNAEEEKVLPHMSVTEYGCCCGRRDNFSPHPLGGANPTP